MDLIGFSELLTGSKGMSMGFLWDFFGISLGFLRGLLGFDRISMGFEFY